MKKYLFLNAEDRRPAEESDYRYKKSKPVTAMKAKRDDAIVSFARLYGWIFYDL